MVEGGWLLGSQVPRIARNSLSCNVCPVVLFIVKVDEKPDIAVVYSEELRLYV